ncbi:MAG: BCCT family transporter [Fusobacterium gastrosuis]|uniref:BCCT family transporter n=1 Tax=Fusobacterium gastrosuis TaxID=1755100 RepID=UPI002A8A20F6|nr:BCCT family transporter [Fusobacterium gastrosuis]
MKKEKFNLKSEVFWPTIIFTGGAAVLGIFNNEALTSISKRFFTWSLDTFGWLYQIVVMLSFFIMFALFFSKLGSVRIGGKDAKANYSFGTWFAMALTGGVASGIVTWGVNEPLIYYGNVWGELSELGIEPFSKKAAIFAIGRSFYNWTFLPYAIYTLCGIIIAYLYFNKKRKLSVTTTLEPLFGEKLSSSKWTVIIDILSMLAIVLGLTSGLTACIVLIVSGISYSYGIASSSVLYYSVGIIIIALFTFSTYIGIDKGLKVIGSLNAYFYYGLLIFLFVLGPTLFILRIGTAGLAEWLHNFWYWGLDPIDIGGVALTRSWTLFDWAVWIAYAPVMGIFLAKISYGRTIREFIIVNLILPSIFGIVWFTVFGGSALDMQILNKFDLVNVLQNTNAVTAVWAFLKNLPFGVGIVIIPINLLIIVASFATAADATSMTVASMCVRNLEVGAEAPGLLKAIWGILIGSIAIIMSAFGGGEQGVDGVKSLATAGGFFVLFIFILQVCAAIKLFFIDKIEE